MKKIKIAVALVAFYFLFSAGWQVAACIIANLELKDDMQEMASQFGAHAGVSAVPTDSELREAILRKAEKYDIALSADRVVVMRTGYGTTASVYLEADYSVPIYLPRYTFQMYFAPSTARKAPASTIATETSPR
jgi:hypothetical protein